MFSNFQLNIYYKHLLKKEKRLSINTQSVNTWKVLQMQHTNQNNFHKSENIPFSKYFTFVAQFKIKSTWPSMLDTLLGQLRPTAYLCKCSGQSLAMPSLKNSLSDEFFFFRTLVSNQYTKSAYCELSETIISYQIFTGGAAFTISSYILWISYRFGGIINIHFIYCCEMMMKNQQTD